MNKKHIKIIEDYSNIKGRSLWVDARRRLFQNKAAVVSLFLIFLIAFLSFFGPFFLKYSFSDTDWNSIYYPPSLNNGHFLGTDGNGRDLLVRILYGGRLSLTIGILATLVSVFIGVIYGTIAGYFGGKLDIFMMRVVEILYAMPYLIFVILLMVVFGRNIYFLFIAIGAVEWLTMARIIRGQVLSIKNQEYVLSAKAIGVSNFYMFRRHIFPNVLGPIAVYATLTIPQVMLLEAFLSFLGLGIQPPMSSWGTLIRYGVESMEEYWWLLVFPGITFTITLFSLNFFGDGLRDALDPKTSSD